MKKTITILAIAAMFAACNTTPKTGTDPKVLAMADTAGLQEFRAYKEQQRIIEQQRLFQTEGINDATNNINTTTPQNTVVANAPVKERIVYITKPAPVHRSTAHTKSSGSSTYSNGSGSVATAPVPAKKKGWSKAAKGTVIGAGSGAVLGAIISKKKGKGAIIGGVLGAAGGYVFGRAKDKKDGRY